MKICFATGSINRWTIFNDPDKVIDFFRQYNFYGCELTFDTPEELFSYELSEKSKEYLRGLNYLSLHLPFRHTYKKDDLTSEVIQKALIMIDNLEIDTVVVHHHQIEDNHYLKQIPVQLCFENMTIKRGFSIKDYKNAIESHPGVRFVLDTTHALTWSMEHLMDIYNTFNSMIHQVHYSEFRKGRKHLPVHEDNHHLLPILNKLDVPIILEVNYEMDDNESFIKDMQFIGLK